ncbi:unnamed protein product [Didymodactylos carnosus]|uniref:RNA-directed DNA polymerase n=1 Tax=Didymodactylos carnosus TaxID=1234261 RepID=A0A814RXF3_9BILA|nr:unnamed protein product [Didymodactylos carnosus]CAF3903581.1 unnamed protein product [Didymodactylos carnosus]
MLYMWSAWALCQILFAIFKPVMESRNGGSGSNNHNIKPSPLTFITVPVNGKMIKTLVDTGAINSIINQSTLSKLHHAPITRKSYYYQLVNKTNMHFIGEVQLKVRIKYITTWVTALVTDSLCTNFILGKDWIRQYQGDVLESSQEIRIRIRSGPVSIPFDEDTENVAFDIKLLHPIILDPRQECEVEAQVPISTADTVIFHPKQQLQHNPAILMPHALLKITNYTTKLTVINLNDHQRHIPRNTSLGVITYAPSSVQCFALTSSSPSKRHSSLDIQHNDSRTQQSPTSSDIDNTIHKLINHLDEQKQQEVYPMLLKHRTLFNLSKMTIANTQIRHVIRTGDHNPISSRPYSKTTNISRTPQQMGKNYLIRRSTSPWASPVVLIKKKDGSTRFCVDYKKLNNITKKDSYPLPHMGETINRFDGHQYFTKLDLKSGYFQIPIQEDDKEKTAFILQDGHWKFDVLPQDPSKCSLIHLQMDYLGHTANNEGVTPLMDKVKALIDLPTPKSIKDVDAFLGAATYEQLKESLSTEPLLLSFADSSSPLVLSTDASDIGYGGVLKQITKDGPKPISYLSRKLNPAEKRYDTTEKECLAMVRCIEEFRSYLLGREFTVKTGHCPLCNFHKKPSKVDRWSIGLGEYDIVEIKYKKGKCNCDADLMSRYPATTFNDQITSRNVKGRMNGALIDDEEEVNPQVNVIY